MKSYLLVYAVAMNIRHCQVVYGIAELAERLRRTLKARVRKSVGSIPTDCKMFFLVTVHPLTGNARPLLQVVGVSLHVLNIRV